MEGRREVTSGTNRRPQVKPLDIYEGERPKPYHDSANPATSFRPTSALYLKIRTNQGLDGLYGPIDQEAAIVVDQQIAPFLIGRDPLAGELLWDQMYRLNRHSRSSHYMMAISAVDNTLWDLRGRYFKAPVYRLLGGPTRPEVEAYASCLGFSLETEKLKHQAAKFKDDGFRYEKWFIAYGPGDGAEGMRKNVEMVRNLREAVGDEVELMFDAFSGWDLNYAIAWAKQLSLTVPAGSKKRSTRRRSKVSSPCAGPRPYPSLRASTSTGAGKSSAILQPVRCMSSRPTPSGAEASANWSRFAPPLPSTTSR